MVGVRVCVCSQAWESDEAIEEDMPESPGAEKHDKEKEHRDSKKGRGMCVSLCLCVIHTHTLDYNHNVTHSKRQP